MINKRKIVKIILIFLYLLIIISTNSFATSINNRTRDDLFYNENNLINTQTSNIDFFIFLGLIFIMAIILVIVLSLVISKYKSELKFKDNYNGYNNRNKKINKLYYDNSKNGRQEFKKLFEGSKALDVQVEKQIKNIDNTFNQEQFLSWVKKIFIEFQNAWTNRDLEKIKQLESDKLFEQHRLQIEENIRNNVVNIIEKINIKSIYLHEFIKNYEEDLITIKLNCMMSDYVIDYNTKQIIKGEKYPEIDVTYYLTFTRKNSKIATNNNEWILSNIERI